MKINEVRPHFESAGQLEEQLFGIQDQGMLFDILRKKMYSNPILAICREISCNARDAHREVGKNVAIQIHLPNNLEPYYMVKDFGPGIDPDRMNNVFIKYTASTKRSDNVQTGGFGLGAKTPFSYSDSFGIVTVVNGTKYNYNCVIDETRVGKLLLLSEEPTDEPNGTEIMIPVQPKHFNDFRVYTEQACRHWKVKPEIINDGITWQTFNVILSGDGWEVTSLGYHGNKEARLIIDEIEYPLDLTTLRNYADPKLIDALRGDIILYFGVGELTLSASREQIYLDEKTQNVIRTRLEEIQKVIKDQAQVKIDGMPNLWEANTYYSNELAQTFNNIDFLGKLEWQGNTLTKDRFFTKTPTFTFTKGKYSRKYGTDPNKLSRSQATHIRFNEHSALFFNDLAALKEPTPRHVKKAFDDDKNLQTLHVICPGEKIDWDELNKTFNLEAMGIRKLSSITKASARTYTPPAARVLVFKFDANATAFRQTSYASIDEDGSNKVLCTLRRDAYNGVRHALLGKNRETLSFGSIKTLMAKFPKHTFYGVDDTAPADRIKEDFSDFIKLEDFIQTKVLDDKSIDYTKIKFASHNRNAVDDKILRIHQQMKPMIKNLDSLYLECVELHKRLRDVNTTQTGLLHIYESLNGVIDEAKLKKFAKDNPDFDIHGMNAKFEKMYPLLDHISSYDYSPIASFIAEYVNLIDSSKDKNNV